MIYNVGVLHFMPQTFHFTLAPHRRDIFSFHIKRRSCQIFREPIFSTFHFSSFSPSTDRLATWSELPKSIPLIARKECDETIKWKAIFSPLFLHSYGRPQVERRRRSERFMRKWFHVKFKEPTLKNVLRLNLRAISQALNRHFETLIDELHYEFTTRLRRISGVIIF